ncbi:enoyl-CoA hydratase/isomerase family protein [Demequina activiva]|uniref:Enoyl-CoA hydratase n=1 Tax=Demequina activiva TaxID=1582364 RepID=A0A919Q5J0_9MICO|nr:enoyl-CoA hydratase/isomerase family protein [Demequina activiva]GIG55562.1 enoyl-CoA hydratase [Demequina activiva]
MSAPVLFRVSDGLAHLTLNRPDRLNAIDAAMAGAWADATREIARRDDIGAVLIDAAGPAFCAGGDVHAMASSPRAAEVTALAQILNEGIVALVTSAVPVVAAAHGTTAGGGLGLLLCSDYAVVGADSVIGSRYAQVGLTPDLSVTAQLSRAVGERRALQLLLSDRMLTASEALEWGLVAEVVDGDGHEQIADAVRERAQAVAWSWLDGATAAYGHAKRLVRASPERSLAEQLADEARSIGTAVETADARARIARFARRAQANGGEQTDRRG